MDDAQRLRASFELVSGMRRRLRARKKRRDALHYLAGCIGLVAIYVVFVSWIL
jgi:hypothetical protein